MEILTALHERLLYLDGGMGTLLQKAGLQPGQRPETWNLTHPDIITGIHRAYFDAGCNVVYTNTFGANPLKFSMRELEDVIRAAVANARRAQRESIGTQDKWVALDIGPSGRLLKPFGDFDFEDAVSMFAEIVRLGVRCGVDLLVIETMNDSYETKAALLAAKENSELPVFVCNAYGADGKLMTGADAPAMIAMLEAMHADAVGVNCSLGPAALRPVVEQYLRCASVPVVVKPNAGLPHLTDGQTVFDVDADAFAGELAAMAADGVRLLGGCCGTTPDYLSRLISRTKDIAPVPLTQKNETLVSSFTHALALGSPTVLIGERINPTGKKRFRQALAAHDIGYVLSEGVRQQEAGAQVLDVNVGTPEVDEAELLPAIVGELQAVSDLPLQIDTSDPVAMECALRRYNGKPLVNSVNGKEESLQAVLPLVRKYGGVLVALTLDEKGIPDTAEGRLRIAEKILIRACSMGIARKDLIFDPLAMTVSTSPDAASVTLTACRLIRETLGCPTLLGVSNISFGLPQRDAVNATFFAMAMENGLSAAIMNPFSYEMMKTYRTYRALRGIDAQCADYIRFTQTAAPVAAEQVPAQTPQVQALTALQNAVMKGLRQEAAALTQRLLADTAPMDIVQNEIIPALDLVGVGFENKTIYLPQLLMSAEAAECAFERIKAAVLKDGTAVPDKCRVVLATVHGDIHDIGKNIVRLLLENYGFSVIDLGRDVPAGEIAEAACKTRAPLVGLSALMTTTVPAMAETIRLLREKAPWCKIVVGGAVLTQECADTIGADAYARDAMQTVRFAETLVGTPPLR